MDLKYKLDPNHKEPSFLRIRLEFMDFFDCKRLSFSIKNAVDSLTRVKHFFYSFVIPMELACSTRMRSSFQAPTVVSFAFFYLSDQQLLIRDRPMAFSVASSLLPLVVN